MTKAGAPCFFESVVTLSLYTYIEKGSKKSYNNSEERSVGV